MATKFIPRRIGAVLSDPILFSLLAFPDSYLLKVVLYWCNSIRVDPVILCVGAWCARTEHAGDP